MDLNAFMDSCMQYEETSKKEDPVDMDKVDAEFRDVLQKMVDNKNKEKEFEKKIDEIFDRWGEIIKYNLEKQDFCAARRSIKALQRDALEVCYNQDQEEQVQEIVDNLNRKTDERAMSRFSMCPFD